MTLTMQFIMSLFSNINWNYTFFKFCKFAFEFTVQNRKVGRKNPAVSQVVVTKPHQGKITHNR